MLLLAKIFIAITALLHCFFFKLESIDFMKPEVLKKFRLSQESAVPVKIWALNQGFYNLFLALALIYSLYLIQSGNLLIGKAIAQIILLIITGAGIVLLVSSPESKLAAMIQALPAFIGFLALFFIKS